MGSAEYREDVLTDEDVELQEPPMYKVLLLNDDYTPMDFVVMILVSVFHKDRPSAERIMMNVHKQGSGLCGVYACEVAEMKVKTVQFLAESNKHPLRCVMEEA